MSLTQTIHRMTSWAVALAALLLPVPRVGAATLKQVATIDLPGPPGKRFDYLTIDYNHRHLRSAHLAAGLLYVIDLNTNTLVKAIPGVPGVEGVEYAPVPTLGSPVGATFTGARLIHHTSYFILTLRRGRYEI